MLFISGMGHNFQGLSVFCPRNEACISRAKFCQSFFVSHRPIFYFPEWGRPSVREFCPIRGSVVGLRLVCFAGPFGLVQTGLWFRPIGSSDRCWCVRVVQLSSAIRGLFHWPEKFKFLISRALQLWCSRRLVATRGTQRASKAKQVFA